MDHPKPKSYVPDDQASSSRTIGHALTVLLFPTGAMAALGPLWALLCGTMASGRWRWQADRLLSLLLTLVIVEALWSTWRAILVDMDWGAYVAAHPWPDRGDPLSLPLYVTPWSPLGHLFVTWARVRRWMRETLPAERRGALLAMPFLPPLILLLSVTAGQPMVLLSLATLALSLIEWRVSRRGSSHRSLQAAMEVGLSWLAGHAVFAPLTWPSFTLACCYALVYQGALSLEDASCQPGRRSWTVALMYGGQICALCLLVLLQHPFAALLSGLICAPQGLLLADSKPGEPRTGHLRRAAPFMALSMLVAAWAV